MSIIYLVTEITTNPTKVLISSDDKCTKRVKVLCFSSKPQNDYQGLREIFGIYKIYDSFCPTMFMLARSVRSTQCCGIKFTNMTVRI